MELTEQIAAYWETREAAKQAVKAEAIRRIEEVTGPISRVTFSVFDDDAGRELTIHGVTTADGTEISVEPLMETLANANGLAEWYDESMADDAWNLLRHLLAPSTNRHGFYTLHRSEVQSLLDTEFAPTGRAKVAHDICEQAGWPTDWLDEWDGADRYLLLLETERRGREALSYQSLPNAGDVAQAELAYLDEDSAWVVDLDTGEEWKLDVKIIGNWVAVDAATAHRQAETP